MKDVEDLGSGNANTLSAFKEINQDLSVLLQISRFCLQSGHILPKYPLVWLVSLSACSHSFSLTFPFHAEGVGKMNSYFTLILPHANAASSAKDKDNAPKEKEKS